MKTTAQIKRQAKRLYQLCLADGSLNENRAIQVVRHVIDSKKRGSMALLTHFQRLVRLDREAHSANVETVVPLPPNLQADVQARLKDLYGPAIQTEFSLKPALIGGMRIKVGSDVYDGSVQSHLASLEKSFEP
jgi:F-type H+-transporting ATPase subunit delta